MPAWMSTTPVSPPPPAHQPTPRAVGTGSTRMAAANPQSVCDGQGGMGLDTQGYGGLPFHSPRILNTVAAGLSSLPPPAMQSPLRSRAQICEEEHAFASQMAYECVIFGDDEGHRKFLSGTVQGQRYQRPCGSLSLARTKACMGQTRAGKRWRLDAAAPACKTRGQNKNEMRRVRPTGDESPTERRQGGEMVRPCTCAMSPSHLDR